MQAYKHRQWGTAILGALGFAGALSVLLLPTVAPGPGRVVVSGALVLLALAMFLFSSLTVEVTSECVSARFGPGVIRKTFAIRSIRAARIVRNRWYYGWGIRRTPAGWMFNVAGLQAVELQLENARKFRIGTDQPEQLLVALKLASPAIDC